MIKNDIKKIKNDKKISKIIQKHANPSKQKIFHQKNKSSPNQLIIRW